MHRSSWPTQNELNILVDFLSHFDLFKYFFSFIGLLTLYFGFYFCVFMLFCVCMLVCFVWFWFCLFF